jgi:alkylation response protein AidB-like acyl-CoA dehydrogenase
MTPAILDSVRSLAPLIQTHADAIEQERALPKFLVTGLIEAGVFRMLMPRSRGGGELDPMMVCRVIEQLAIYDGAVSWCGMIGASNGYFAALLPKAGADEVYRSRDVVLAGAFRPTGTAVAVDGSYRVTGRWPFASGIMHSDWILGGCRVFDGDRARVTAAGAPVAKLVFVPRTEATVLDTWYSGGLRGTGSHDYEIKDVFVPAHRAAWFSEPRTEDGPLYRLPTIGFFSTMIASVALGIARHALEIFKSLAAVKKPLATQELLRTSAVAQSQLGEAEGLLRAGRAFMFEALSEAWSVVCGGASLDWHQRGLLWLSATQATTQSLQALDLVYRAGGASSVYATTQLERCLRDIRTASQHLTVMPTNYEVAGQYFLGADVSGTSWGRDNRDEW